MLFGGGILRDSLMVETKPTEVIGTGLLKMSGATSVWGIAFGAIFIAGFVSGTSSNPASFSRRSHPKGRCRQTSA
jgi:hypothetical protein